MTDDEFGIDRHWDVDLREVFAESDVFGGDVDESSDLLQIDVEVWVPQSIENSIERQRNPCPCTRPRKVCLFTE